MDAQWSRHIHHGFLSSILDFSPKIQYDLGKLLRKIGEKSSEKI